MSSYIQLDVPYKKILLAIKFTVSIYEYILFERICIAVRLFDINELLVEIKHFSLEGEDYNNWSLSPYNGSDSYINDYVKNKLKSENIA